MEAGNIIALIIIGSVLLYFFYVLVRTGIKVFTSKPKEDDNGMCEVCGKGVLESQLFGLPNKTMACKECTHLVCSFSDTDDPIMDGMYLVIIRTGPDQFYGIRERFCRNWVLASEGENILAHAFLIDDREILTSLEAKKNGNRKV